MTPVRAFQNELATKMSLYFRLKLEDLRVNDDEIYGQCVQDYIRQQEHILHNDVQEQYQLSTDYENVLLKGISEAETDYSNEDFQPNSGNNDKIYSPRVDVAFTPVIRKRSSEEAYLSIGVKKLTIDVQLFKKLNQLTFVRDIETAIRRKSNQNMVAFGLQQNNDSLFTYNENEYLNKRPLLLFGFEIENSRTSKYLMGDFLNIISLARIPTVVVRERTMIHCMNMLKFCSTIGDLKEVPIYDLLKKANVVSVNQLRDLMNHFLRGVNLEEIGVRNYR